MRKIAITLLCAAVFLSADSPRRAPGFSLVDTRMQMHDLADYRGKVVILEFMQTTCPHCASFTPVLQQVQKKFGDQVAILAVLNPPDTAADGERYIAEHQITYPLLMDCGQMAYSYVLAQTLQFPRVFVIDGDGMVRQDYIYGPLTRGIFEGGLVTEIDKLVNTGASRPKK